MLGVEDFYTRMPTYHSLLFVFFHEVWKAVTMYTQVVHPRKSWPWMDTVILPSAQDLADPSVFHMPWFFWNAMIQMNN